MNPNKILIGLLAFGLLLPRMPIGKSNLLDQSQKNNNIWSYFNWKSSAFQDTFESNFKMHFRSNTFLTQLKNQIEYSFFNRSNAPNMIVGQAGFVYSKNDLGSLKGDNYMGQKYMHRTLQRLQYVSDRLAEKNKKMVLVMTPSKASINEVLAPNATPNNYNTFTNSATNFGLNFIDFNKYFEASPKKEHLFTKADQDLDAQASVFMLDSTLRFCSKQLSIELKKPKTTGTTEIEDTSATANPLNLLFAGSSKKSSPQITFDGKTAPKRMMLIGDNSSKPFVETNFVGETFAGGTYWLNGNEVIDTKDPSYAMSFEKSLLVQEVGKSDLVLVMIEPSNLDNIGFGAIDFLYDFYSPEGSLGDEYSEYERNCDLERQKILLNPEHKRLVMEDAKKKKINFYDNLRGHIEYTLSLLKNDWNMSGNKISDYQAQSILVKNQLLKQKNIKKQIIDSSKVNNWTFDFTLSAFARDRIEKSDKQGFASVRDSICPLQLAIIQAENKILLDSAWYAMVVKQAKEKNISLDQNLWENAKYTLWLEYDAYFNSLDEAKKWINDLYYTNEIRRRPLWMKHIEKQALIEKRLPEEIVKENMLFLAFSNKARGLDISIDEAWVLQQCINIRTDKSWYKKVADEAKQKKVSTEANLREHAEYMYFLQKQASGGV